MHVLIGLAILVVGYVNMRRLGRWAGAGQRLRPNFPRLFVFMTVGWGTPVTGLYYAQSGSVSGSVRAGVVTAVFFGSFMTLFFAFILGWWRVFRPQSYAFTRAWMDEHARRGVRIGNGGFGRTRRTAAVTKHFRERWEAQPGTPPLEFIEAHWDEIVRAEADAARVPDRVVR